MYARIGLKALVSAIAVVMLTACAGRSPDVPELPPVAESGSTEYTIGPGDMLKVFVWRHEDLSTTVPVRPDGRISTPLVEDMPAAGKTPTALARDIEVVLEEYIRSPTVNIIVEEFIGTFGEQIRVVGQAANPQALPYRDGMTLLDVMIAVGGLGEFAAGNRGKVIRRAGDEQTEIKVRIDDLVNDGDIRQNLVMRPGDVVIIPEARF